MRRVDGLYQVWCEQQAEQELQAKEDEALAALRGELVAAESALSSQLSALRAAEEGTVVTADQSPWNAFEATQERVRSLETRVDEVEAKINEARGVRDADNEQRWQAIREQIAHDEAEADRRHTWRLAGAFIFMAVCTFLLFLGLDWPFQDSDAGIPRTAPDALVAGAMIVLLGLWLSGFIAALFDGADRARHWSCYVSVALVAPALLIAWWAIWLRPVHPVQREAISVFNRYVTHFPADALGTPSIAARNGSIAVVCADRAGAGGVQFCAAIDTARPNGTQVLHSFNQPPSPY